MARWRPCPVCDGQDGTCDWCLGGAMSDLVHTAGKWRLEMTNADTEAGRGEELDRAINELELALDEPCLCGDLEPGCPFCDDTERAVRKIREAARRFRQSDTGGERCKCRVMPAPSAPVYTGACPFHDEEDERTWQEVLAKSVAPTDEAPEGAVYATISCENPECGSRGPEPRKLYDGEVLDHCQVCCEETLVLRLRAAPPVEEGERGSAAHLRALLRVEWRDLEYGFVTGWYRCVDCGQSVGAGGARRHANDGHVVYGPFRTVPIAEKVAGIIQEETTK